MGRWRDTVELSCQWSYHEWAPRPYRPYLRYYTINSVESRRTHFLHEFIWLWSRCKQHRSFEWHLANSSTGFALISQTGWQKTSWIQSFFFFSIHSHPHPHSRLPIFSGGFYWTRAFIAFDLIGVPRVCVHNAHCSRAFLGVPHDQRRPCETRFSDEAEISWKHTKLLRHGFGYISWVERSMPNTNCVVFLGYAMQCYSHSNFGWINKTRDYTMVYVASEVNWVCALWCAPSRR